MSENPWFVKDGQWLQKPTPRERRHTMEKQVLTYSYWLGVVCLVVTVLWRGLQMLGIEGAFGGMAHTTFFKGAVLLFVAAIASASYARSKS